jgi:HD-like signal output (HDOD) protein
MLVADPNAKACEEFRQALGDSWVVAGAASSSAALAETQKQRFDAVVANYTLPDLGGAELLDRIRAATPETLRFIAAKTADKEKVMNDVLGGHQFLAIPFDRATLKISIERSLAANSGMSQSMRDLLGRIRTFPTIPSLYLEVINALQSSNATTAEVGAIIARDMAMTTKLVQVLNSAYFGLSRTITDPTEAVGMLGFETTKSLIMAIKLLSQYDKVKPVYFSIDHIWRHSTNVARTAKALALLETGDPDCSSTAYTAGLMHDLGKVILASNFDTQYHAAHDLARKQNLPLWVVEKDIFGATHGEIGAYILALWGMSAEVVKVASLHHDPLRAGDKTFTALTAVHVANALEYEETPDVDGLPAPMFDMAYLQDLGLENRVDLWREARREQESARAESVAQRTPLATKRADKVVRPEPPPPTNKFLPATLPPGAVLLRDLWKWLAIGLGVTATLVFLARVEVVRLENSMEQAQQTTESPPAARTEITATTTHTVVQPPAAVVRPSPKPVAAPPRDPAAKAFDDLKLQAIFFNSSHPSALINGRMTAVNQNVAECRVLEIRPSSVTLAYQDQRRTLLLP